MKARGPGRPKLPKSERIGERLTVQLRATEKRALEVTAERADISLGGLIRRFARACIRRQRGNDE